MQLPSPLVELESKLVRLERFLQTDLNNRKLLMEIIDTTLALDRMHSARKYIDHAVSLFPADSDIQKYLAIMLLEEGNLKESASIFEALLCKAPNQSSATNLAFIYLQQGRHSDAASLLEQYIESNETDAISSTVITLYVRALHHLGNLDKAVEIIHKHIDRCKADSNFLAASSLVLLDNEQFEDAKAVSTAALSLGARPIEAVVVAGTLALADLDTENANARFEEAVTLNPNDGRSWSGLGLVSLLKQDLAAASQQLTNAIAYMPNHIGTLHAFAWTKILSHDLTTAQSYFEQALILDRNFSESHGGMAVMFALQGNADLSEKSITLALRLNGKCFSARFAQLALSGALNDPDKFRTIVYRALSHQNSPDGKNMGDMLTKFMATHRSNIV